MNFVRLSHDRVTFDVDRSVSTAIRFVCLVVVGSGEELLIHPLCKNGSRFKFLRGLCWLLPLLSLRVLVQMKKDNH